MAASMAAYLLGVSFDIVTAPAATLSSLTTAANNVKKKEKEKARRKEKPDRRSVGVSACRLVFLNVAQRQTTFHQAPAAADKAFLMWQLLAFVVWFASAALNGCRHGHDTSSVV